MRDWLRSAGSRCAPAAAVGAAAAAAAAAVGLVLQSGAEAGFEAHESLLDLRETLGGLGTAVQASWCDGGGHGPLDKVGHPLARVLVQAGFGKQRRDALEAGFVAFSVTVCRA